MKIEYEVCDHCGKELNYFGWASKVWKVKKWFNGTGVSDKSYTFCNECGKSCSDDEKMEKISFKDVSVCLCSKCFNRFLFIMDCFSHCI